jgi:hypothetical protein
VTGRRGEALVDDRTTRTASPDLDATWIHQRPGRRCISTAHTRATANCSRRSRRFVTRTDLSYRSKVF